MVKLRELEKIICPICGREIEVSEYRAAKSDHVLYQLKSGRIRVSCPMLIKKISFEKYSTPTFRKTGIIQIPAKIWLDNGISEIPDGSLMKVSIVISKFNWGGQP